jgi:hypothetical protein
MLQEGLFVVASLAEATCTSLIGKQSLLTLQSFLGIASLVSLARNNRRRIGTYLPSTIMRL